MASILDTVTQTASSTWETISGGFERWVGLETEEEIDRLGDNTYAEGSAQPQDGYRTTGQPAPDPGRTPTAGGGMGLEGWAAVAGIVAAGVIVWQAVR